MEALIDFGKNEPIAMLVVDPYLQHLCIPVFACKNVD